MIYWYLWTNWTTWSNFQNVVFVKEIVNITIAIIYGGKHNMLLKILDQIFKFNFVNSLKIYIKLCYVNLSFKL